MTELRAMERPGEDESEEEADSRPQGRAEVKAALKEAALALLAERGLSFSIRQVAKRAKVNHGLVHRHFGTKQQLVTAALADRSSALRQQLSNDTSPLDLTAGGPSTAVLLARLILDDATSLVADHASTTALVERTAEHVDADDPLSPADRAALANGITLGWSVFGEYFLQAAGASSAAPVTAALHNIVDNLLEGRPVG